MLLRFRQTQNLLGFGACALALLVLTLALACEKSSIVDMIKG